MKKINALSMVRECPLIRSVLPMPTMGILIEFTGSTTPPHRSK